MMFHTNQTMYKHEIIDMWYYSVDTSSAESTQQLNAFKKLRVYIDLNNQMTI